VHTLYCPNRDYNLTGLPENRCSECGRRFDPQRLAASLEDGLRPITPWVATVRCLLWLSLFWSLQSFCVALCGLPGLGPALLLSVSILNLMMEDSREIALRLAVRRAVRSGHPGALLEFNPGAEAHAYVRTVTEAIILAMLVTAFLVSMVVLRVSVPLIE